MKKSISIALSILLLTGCSSKNRVPNDKLMTSRYLSGKVATLNSDPDLLNVKKEYGGIPVSGESVKTVLKKLSNKYDQKYILLGDDLPLKSSNVQIYGITDLEKYLFDTTDFRLKRLNKPYEEIEQFEIVAKDGSLQKIPFRTEFKSSDVTLAEIFHEISSQSGYSVIPDDTIKEKYDSETIHLTYRADNLYKFFDYLQNAFDIYIDVDNKEKIIRLTKIKQSTFEIPIPNSGAGLKGYEARINEFMKYTANDSKWYLDAEGNRLHFTGEFSKYKEILKFISELKEDMKTIIGVKIDIYKVVTADTTATLTLWDKINPLDVYNESSHTFYRGKRVELNSLLKNIGKYAKIEKIKSITLNTNPSVKQTLITSKRSNINIDTKLARESDTITINFESVDESGTNNIKSSISLHNGDRLVLAGVSYSSILRAIGSNVCSKCVGNVRGEDFFIVVSSEIKEE